MRPFQTNEESGTAAVFTGLMSGGITEATSSLLSR